MKQNVQRLGKLTLGSTCTGSNVTVVMARELLQVLGEGTVEELYTCELNKNKRKWGSWLQPNESVSHSYVDIADLKHLCAPCEAHGEGRNGTKLCVIPSGSSGPLISTCGFSCKNLSKAYPPTTGSP